MVAFPGFYERSEVAFIQVWPFKRTLARSESIIINKSQVSALYKRLTVTGEPVFAC